MLRQIINDKVILLNSGALTVSFMNVERVLKLLLMNNQKLLDQVILIFN